MLKIHLELIHIEPNGLHLLLDVKVNNYPIKLVLDTGASRTVMDLEFLKSIEPELEIKEEEAKSAGVGAIDIASYSTILTNFGIGELTLPKFEIAIMDLASVIESYEAIGAAKIHGVLGGDILLKGQAIINYATKELQLNASLLKGE